MFGFSREPPIKPEPFIACTSRLVLEAIQELEFAQHWM